MDIIQLLDVLRSSDHAITVKVVNDSQFLDSLGKILIAIVPAIISFLALLFSYWQFKANTQKQSEQFALGIEQQLKTLRLNTQLATEIELKKEVCKEVRAAYVVFMKNHSELYAAKLNYKSLCDREDAEGDKKRQLAHEVVMEKGQLSLNSKMLLDSYLDLNDTEDRLFFDSLVRINEMAFNADCTGAELGHAQGDCAGICFNFIERRRREITSLVDTIAS